MRRFEDVAVGEDLPSLVRVVTREDVKAYADAGGDQNALHQDDAVAREAGFPGVIAHGMLTMGHMAACVVSWCGDPASITGLSAQFRAPVLVGETIVAGGRVSEVDPLTRTAILETWVTLERDGRTHQAVRKGVAVVRFP
ncbi:MAG: MaoC/PaaZ C-terminal domain-containing protein [Actinomycetota bacterium]